MQQTIRIIDEIFKRNNHQADVIRDLFLAFCPGLNYMAARQIWPRCGQLLSRYIWSEFLKFDALYHPHDIPGGCWFRTGFTTDPRLPPWEVDMTHTVADPVRVTQPGKLRSNLR